MNAEFWHQRWQSARIGFHRQQVNTHLKDYWATLNVPENSHVLVPLCGKSNDMQWLAEQGYSVSGFELSPVAIADFYAQIHQKPKQQAVGPYQYWQGEQVSIYQGDFFQASELNLHFDSAYDRAALIALPAHMQADYVTLLAQMLNPGGVVLLITVHYAPEQQQSPPFSVSEPRVRTLFERYFTIDHCATLVEGAGNRRVASGELTFFNELCFVLKRKS